LRETGQKDGVNDTESKFAKNHQSPRPVNRLSYRHRRRLFVFLGPRK